MSHNEAYAHVMDRDSGHQIYVKSDSVNVNEVMGVAGGAITKASLDLRKKKYVFRKMGETEFHDTVSGQKVQPQLGNPRSGEKWLTEHLDHSRVFNNAGVSEAERVAEIALDRDAYTNMRGSAIPQAGSKGKQPPTGDMYNITTTERLTHREGKLNIGLKGNKNVDKFNKHVLSIKEVDPHSYVNKSEALMWCRRNKINIAFAAAGIAVDSGYITVSVIEDDGTFGVHTQIALGESVAGLAGAEAAAAIGSAIGAAVGSVLPVIGTAVIGFIGSLIGSIIGGEIVRTLRFWFCGGPIAPGPGAPLLNTDPYPTASGIPSTRFDTRASGVPSQQINTYAKGVPSMGLQTGAQGTPRMDFKTRGQRH